MIKVGFSKPKLQFHHASNDMSHFFPSQYSVTDYFLMEAGDFIEKREFGSFNMEPKLTEQELAEILDRVNRGPFTPEEEMILQFTNPWEYQMRYWIKRSGGMIWQFNAIDKNLNGYCWQIVCMGKSKLYILTWFDAYVVYPILSKIASILNYLRIQKVKNEIKSWDNYLRNLRKAK